MFDRIVNIVKQNDEAVATKTLQATIKRKNQSKTIQQKAFENITNDHYEQQADQYAKTEASKILKSKAKRAVTNQAYNELDKQDAGEKIAAAIAGKVAQNRSKKAVHKINGVNRLEKAQKQNAFNSFQNAL